MMFKNLPHDVTQVQGYFAKALLKRNEQWHTCPVYRYAGHFIAAHKLLDLSYLSFIMPLSGLNKVFYE